MTQERPAVAGNMPPDQIMLWAVRVGVVLVTLVPLVVVDSTIFPFIVGKAIYARLAIEITFALWLALVLIYPQHRPHRSWVILAFGVWVLASVIAAFAGVSLSRSLWSTYERMHGVVDLAHWLAFALMSATVFRTFTDWRRLFSINLAVCLIVALLGIAQYYGIDGGIVSSAAFQRIGTTLGNPTYVAAYTLVNALIAFGLLIQSLGGESRDGESPSAARETRARRRRQMRGRQTNRLSFDYLSAFQMFWIVSILLNLWALWLTGTRGGPIALGAAALVAAVAYLVWGKMQLARRVCYATVGVVALGGVVITTLDTTSAFRPLVESSTMTKRLASISVDDRSINRRILATRAGYEAFLDKPLFGWGPENFIVSWGRHISSVSDYEDLFDYRPFFDQAHNKLVEELTTKGVLGLVSYMLIWLVMARTMILLFVRRQGYEQLMVLILATAMMAYFIHNLFLFDTPATVMQFGLLVAFVATAEGWIRAHDGQREQAWLPAAWSDRLRVPALGEVFSTLWARTLLVGVVSALIIAAIVLMNIPAYSGGVSAKRFLQSGGESWDNRKAHFEDMVSAFPGLANQPRMIGSVALASTLHSLSDEEFDDTMDFIREEGQKALEVEPQNWTIMMEMAIILQEAALRDGDVPNAEYTLLAREQIDRVMDITQSLLTDTWVEEKQKTLEEEVR